MQRPCAWYPEFERRPPPVTLPTPRVFVVDDDPSVRKALQRVLISAGFAVSVFGSAEDYLARYDPGEPGCLVLDVAMPGFTGLELQDALAARGDAPPIIFVTGHAGIPDSVRAMKRGAVEFLTKPVDDQMLIAAIRSAVTRDDAGRSERRELAAIRARLASLTPRESEVLDRILSGKANKVIAGELGIVEKTVKVHRARVIEKMQAKSLAELIQVALRAGPIRA